MILKFWKWGYCTLVSGWVVLIKVVDVQKEVSEPLLLKESQQT